MVKFGGGAREADYTGTPSAGGSGLPMNPALTSSRGGFQAGGGVLETGANTVSTPGRFTYEQGVTGTGPMGGNWGYNSNQFGTQDSAERLSKMLGLPLSNAQMLGGFSTSAPQRLLGNGLNVGLVGNLIDKYGFNNPITQSILQRDIAASKQTRSAPMTGFTNVGSPAPGTLNNMFQNPVSQGSTNQNTANPFSQQDQSGGGGQNQLMQLLQMILGGQGGGSPQSNPFQFASSMPARANQQMYYPRFY